MRLTAGCTAGNGVGMGVSDCAAGMGSAARGLSTGSGAGNGSETIVAAKVTGPCTGTLPGKTRRRTTALSRPGTFGKACLSPLGDKAS